MPHIARLFSAEPSSCRPPHHRPRQPALSRVKPQKLTTTRCREEFTRVSLSFGQPYLSRVYKFGAESWANRSMRTGKGGAKHTKMTQNSAPSPNRTSDLAITSGMRYHCAIGAAGPFGYVVLSRRPRINYIPNIMCRTMIRTKDNPRCSALCHPATVTATGRNTSDMFDSVACEGEARLSGRAAQTRPENRRCGSGREHAGWP